MNGMNGNAAVIRMLFNELRALGVREFCVCAGARNAAIIDVLSRPGSGFVLRHFFEERSAAFFALGRIVATREPVAVLTTSGTAAAELLPAMIEAHYQNLPLIAVTADRPLCYQGSGAPQVIEQTDLFGSYAQARLDLEAGHSSGVSVRSREGSVFNGGPVHLNVRLEEGLVDGVAILQGTQTPPQLSPMKEDAFPEAAQRGIASFFEAEGQPVVLAGGIHPSDVPAVVNFLTAFGVPVVAEETANLASIAELQPLLLRGGERALKELDAMRVLRIGSVPSWRWWRDVDARENVRVLNISRTPFRGLARTKNVTTFPWSVLGIVVRRCTAFVQKLPDHTAPLSRALEAHPRSEPAWMRHLSRVIGENARVLLGNSLPVREWNLAADAPKRGTAFFANRGANGIDGMLSTWLGLSEGAAESWCVLGDLSALYDLSAPWILPQLSRGKRRIVIINNGGGKIFSRVGWLRSLPEDARRVMENPHAIGFEAWARMWSMDYRLVTDPAQLKDDASPCAVWEIRPDEKDTAAFWTAWQG